MKFRYILIVLLLFIGLESFSQKDLILFRDGTECQARVTMVNSDKTYYTIDKSREESVQNTTIYMIQYEKRGNVFFTEQGEWYTTQGEKKAPRGATLIYLLEGKEIAVYNLTMDASKVSFSEGSKKNARSSYIAKAKIFMIKYPDGTKEMLNDFESVRQMKKAIEEEERRQAEEKQRLEEARRLPRDVSITTRNNIVIKAELLAEDNDIVKYKKKSVKNSPVYTMKKENIKEMTNN